MEVTFGNLLQSVTPPDTKIDSRYDLKSWWFSTGDNVQRRQTTWLRVKTADSWEMDLPLTLGASYWCPFVSGALVAAPAILALVTQDLEVHIKIYLSAIGVAVGVLSSFLAAGTTREKS